MADGSLQEFASVPPVPAMITNRQRWALVLVSLVVVAAALLASPPSWLGKCDLVGYSLCHRMPDHSFFVAGRQLPLCARCTGTYLGAGWALLYIAVIRRRRPGRLPPGRILAALLVFFFGYGLDGMNSYLDLFPTFPHLYEPHNLLRLVAGSLNGLTVGALVLPLFNSAYWPVQDTTPSVQGWRDLFVLLAGAGVLTALTATGLPLLLYPLAIASALSVVVILTLVNTTVLLMMTGREGRMGGWAKALPLLWGLDLAIIEMGVLVVMRGLLTGWFDVPV